MLQRVRPGPLRLVFAILLLVSVGSGAAASAQETAPTTAPTTTEGRTVRIAVRQLPPFVEKHGDHYSGLTIELWERIAAQNGWKTEFIEVPDVNAMLDAVATGKADVAATAISVTSEREDRFDFSHPYFDAGLQIMVPSDRQMSFGALFHALTSPSLRLLFAVFLAGLMIVGAIVAIIERKTNPEFAHFGPRAVLEGMWWGLTTAATVGYGDRVTRTGAGRIIAAFWIIFGVIFIAQLTATVTASLTGRELRSDIRGPQDLGGHEVVTVRGTTAATRSNTSRLGGSCCSMNSSTIGMCRHCPRPSGVNRRCAQLVDAPADVVAHRAHSVEAHPVGISQLPVEVARGRYDRARVATPHRHHEIRPLGVLDRQRARNAIANIEAELVHRIRDLCVYALGGRASRRPRLESGCLGKCLRHL